ncbi:hypothetical protein BST61_g9280 [Cercospora zeina]
MFDVVEDRILMGPAVSSGGECCGGPLLPEMSIDVIMARVVESLKHRRNSTRIAGALAQMMANRSSSCGQTRTLKPNRVISQRKTTLSAVLLSRGFEREHGCHPEENGVNVAEHTQSSGEY